MPDSNIDQFCASLEALKSPLDFTRDRLGRRVADQQAKRILDRAADERGPKSKWKKNRGKYGEAKRKKGLKVGVGLRPSDSPMLLPENVRGEVEVEPGSVAMRYGTPEAPRMVAEYFSEGTATQVARPFFDVNASDARAIRDECEKAVNAHLKGH